jgi:hypothetical protein
MVAMHDIDQPRAEEVRVVEVDRPPRAGSEVSLRLYPQLVQDPSSRISGARMTLVAG